MAIDSCSLVEHIYIENFVKSSYPNGVQNPHTMCHCLNFPVRYCRTNIQVVSFVFRLQTELMTLMVSTCIIL
jgi:hypothetical protein